MTPMTARVDDRVLPAFSSGQWAGTVQATWRALGSADLLFLAGGGIMAHPGGPAAGVASIRQAWDAVQRGEALDVAAKANAELKHALAFFGGAIG
jgi:ribulose-bisphosphate carboxylase large chain